jgi:anaerobic selenocysteine-containing dehydrogenase
MRQHPTTCPLDCPDACGVLVETDEHGAFAGLRGDPAHPWSRGSLCGKTAIFGEIQASPDRLARPLARTRGGALEPVSWERALGIVAERLAPLAHGDVLALSYAGSMGLVGRNFPMRVLNALGAIGTDGGICDNTPTDAWRLVMGAVIGADIEDMESADLLVLWGIDVRRTLQHAQPRIHALLARGVPVWTIDVYRTDTIRSLEKLGGRSLVVKPGSDAMLALALARIAYEEGFADRDFLARECLGADAFAAHVRSGHDIQAAAAATGLAPGEIRAFAAALARA